MRFGTTKKLMNENSSKDHSKIVFVAFDWKDYNGMVEEYERAYQELQPYIRSKTDNESQLGMFMQANDISEWINNLTEDASTPSEAIEVADDVITDEFENAGVFVYPDPFLEGSDTYGWILSTAPLTEEERDIAAREYWGFDEDGNSLDDEEDEQ